MLCKTRSECVILTASSNACHVGHLRNKKKKLFDFERLFPIMCGVGKVQDRIDYWSVKSPQPRNSATDIHFVVASFFRACVFYVVIMYRVFEREVNRVFFAEKINYVSPSAEAPYKCSALVVATGFRSFNVLLPHSKHFSDSGILFIRKKSLKLGITGMHFIETLPVVKFFILKNKSTLAFLIVQVAA